jgi:CSLREA domain-containing protein
LPRSPVKNLSARRHRGLVLIVLAACAASILSIVSGAASAVLNQLPRQVNPSALMPSAFERIFAHRAEATLSPPALFAGGVSLTAAGTAYTQDFNSLATSGSGNTWTDDSTIPGWYSNRATYNANAGTDTAGDVYSYGSAASSERALGALSSGSVSPILGLRMTNNTGATISSLSVSFTGEQWRQTANAQTLTFEYQVGATSITTGTWSSVSALNFAAIKTGSAGSLDGNNAANRTSKSAKVSASVTNGQEIWFRWSKSGSTSPGLAIDDFSVTPTNTISGTLFDSTGLPITSGLTINLLQNGTSVGTTTTNPSGDYTFNDLTLVSGDRIAVFIDGATEKGASVTMSSTADIAGFNIYQNQLVVRTETGSITNANLSNGQGGAPDSDLTAIYTVSGSDLTTAAGVSLQIWSSSSYAPGGNINDGGNWTNNGTFTAGANTVKLNSSAGNQSIGGNFDSNFSTLTIDNVPVNPTPSTSNIVSLAVSTHVTTALNVTHGVFNQGASTADDFTLTTNTVTVGSGATWQNLGKGDVQLAGNVANNGGSIIFNSNGTPCGDAIDILIRSSDTSGVVGTTQRTWTGTGTFSMTDVDVRDQIAGSGLPPVPSLIIVNSGHDSGNNIRWTFSGTCDGPYTWIGGANQSWIVPTNWSPVRATAANPTTSDVLIFNGNFTPAPTVTNVPSQTNAAVRLQNAVFGVTLNAGSGGATLTLNGGTGTDLDVPGGTLLTLAGANPIVISLIASGHECTIAGQLFMQDGAHQLLGTNAGEITMTGFNAFTTDSTYNSSTHPFGTGTSGSVVFQSGATGAFHAGLDPFGGAGKSVATFNQGSFAKFFAASAFAADGRSYGYLTLDGSQEYSAGSATNALTTLNNFELEIGSKFTLSDTAGGDLNLLGNFEDMNTSDGMFIPLGRTVKFQGTGTQGIYKPSGTLSFFDVLIAQTAAVDKVQFSNSGFTLAINGQLNLSTANSLLELNGGTLSLSGTVTGDGNLKGDFAAVLTVNGSGDLGTLNFVAGGRELDAFFVNRSGPGSVTLGNDLTVGGTTTLADGVVDMGTFTLTVNGVSRTNGWIIGNEQRTFAAAGPLPFDVGTANGYSPVTVNATTGTFPANFTVKAIEGAMPGVSGTNKLARYWTLTNTTITEANLTFNYLGTDVTGTAANYQFIKKSGGNISILPPTGTPTNTSATINGVTSFSDWTLAEPSAVVPGTIAFLGAPFSDAEGTNFDHDVTITLRRSGGSDGAVSVHWATSAGTAIAGTDYVEATGDVGWGDGDTVDKTFLVRFKGDSTYEPNETVNLTLSAPTGGATLGVPNPSTVTLINDDGPPSTTLTINTLDDVDNGACLASHCSLREAVNAANFDVDTSTVIFQAGLTGTITLGSELTLSTPMLINGPGVSVITVSGNNDTTRAFHITATGVSLSDLTIADANSAIVVAATGGASVNNIYFNGNDAPGGGGAISVGSTGSISVDKSTFFNNTGNDGGAISNGAGTVVITNSTISGNHADGFSGGGISQNGTGSVTIVNSTIKGNTAATGGGIRVFSGTVNIRNTIVAGNTATSSGPDVFGTFNSEGHNFIGKSDGSSGFGASGDHVGTVLSPLDPMLDALANYGGPTPTHRLQAGSTAIDAGDDCVVTGSCITSALTTDQRGTGFPRQVDGNGDSTAIVDIGAYETTFTCPTITVSPASLPAGTAGSSYPNNINASGGTGPYTFAITIGSAPTGLMLNSDGTWSGTATAPGSFSFTVTATDSITNCTGTRAYTVTINCSAGLTDCGGACFDLNTDNNNCGSCGNACPSGTHCSAGGCVSNCPTITVNPASLSDGTVGIAYTDNISASGGTGPYTFAVTAGSVPTGLTLNPNGAWSGTPTAGGTFNFTVTATDSNTCTGSQAYTVKICPNVLVVNVTDDTDDVNPGDGVCADSSSNCSLRGAIQEANATCLSGPITINFDSVAFAAPGPYTILLGSALPALHHDITINGPGADVLSIDGQTTDRIFRIDSGFNVNISALGIGNGYTDSSEGGGGILNFGTLTLTDSTVAQNKGSRGGGINNEGTLTLRNSIIANNEATRAGGGIRNTGTLTLVNTLVLLNFADKNGGGIHNDNSEGSTNPIALIVNSTIAVNVADADDLNGDGDGGGIYNNGGAVRLINTIVATNFLGDGTDSDICGGTDVDTANSSHNLIGVGESGGLINGNNGNQVGVLDPKLGEGGAPLPGSPAIDAGDDCVLTNACAPSIGFNVTTDLFGLTRPQGTHVDIGAFEVRQAVVNTTADHDDGACEALVNGDPSKDCTLREAINVANAHPRSMIAFAIPDSDTGCVSGVCTISPTTNLPAITNWVFIDGYTQQPCPPSPTGPCSHPNTLSLNAGDDAALLIVLNGSNVLSDGRGLDLEQGSSRSTIRGLVINHWNTAGIYIKNSSQNTIAGNFIGTDAAGANPAGAAGGAGVLIVSDCNADASENEIGGDFPKDRNLISGNGDVGINIGANNGECVTGTVVEGNYIGTDRNGLAAIPNAESGIVIQGTSEGNTVGFEVLDGDNVISGNTGAGITILSNQNLVIGNFIGTDRTGLAPLPNLQGIVITGAQDNFIGVIPFFAVFGNVISGNLDDGIAILGGSNNTIQGNYIGTNLNGAVASGMGNGGNGVEVYIGTVPPPQNATNNTIGGPFQDIGEIADKQLDKTRSSAQGSARTLSSAQWLAKVRARAQALLSRKVAGAKTKSSGTALDPNPRTGAKSNSITPYVLNTSGANTIAGNGEDGVRVSSNGDFNNLISQNSIFSNTGLGINLGTDGVTANNSADHATGPNHYQNFPVINSADPGTQKINFSIDGTGGTGLPFTIEFFTNDVCDGTNGEGKTFLGSTTVNSGGPFDYVSSNTFTSGQVITATATDSNNNTSEFSACFCAGKPTTPTASNDGPYCEGGTINLSTPTVAGATYYWTGPNGFAQQVQNPTRTNISTSDAGTYSVTVTVDGCPSDPGTTNVVVNATPGTPTASNTGPYIEGQTIQLSSGTVAGATYSWTGPNSFTSSLQNPTRANATIADAGDYLVTVTVDGCTSLPRTTKVDITACPTNFTVISAGDGGDSNPGDGLCRDSNQSCTLRAAIEEANALPTCGTINIDFAIGTATITFTLSNGQMTIDHDVNIIGPPSDSVVVDGNNSSRLFTVNAGKTASISNLTLSRGNGRDTPSSSAGDGGAIQNNGALTLKGVTLRANAAISGGAIRSDGALVLVNTTISGNLATGDGGGLYNAINQATLTNVTVAYNRANSDSNPSGTGGGVSVAGGNVLLHNTIVADNYNGGSPSTTADDIGGLVDSSSSYNLVGNGSGGLTNGGATHNQTGVATALLGALMNNNGPTFTHGLLYNSPAIDAGDASVLGSPLFVNVDQRGLTRPDDGDNSGSGGVDIGAYERQLTETRTVPSGLNAGVDINDARLTFPCVPAGSCGDARAKGDTAIRPEVERYAVDLKVLAVPPDAPSGSGPAFDVTPNSTFYDSPVTVCFYLPSVTNPTNFASLKVLHREGGILVDHGSTTNFSDKTVCTQVPSFSQFVIVQNVTPTATDASVSGQIVDDRGQPVEGAAVRMNGTQNRLTITDAEGKYSFDEVETNGLYIITPSRANFTFSPSQRSFSQLGAHTDATFTASPTAGGLNPLDTTEYFVRQQYVDFLGREPDEAGFNFWVRNIDSCANDSGCREVKRIDTSVAFFFSIEFQQTGYLVYRTYQAAYGDAPNAPVPLILSEFKPDTLQISSRVVVLQDGWQQRLENNKRAFIEDFVRRRRFMSAYPQSMTPVEFVDKLFANAGVPVAHSDYALAIAEFARAADTSDVTARARALRRVAENQILARQEFNQAFVLMEYFGYLNRDPNTGQDNDFSGYNFWLDKLNRFNGNFQNAEMVKAFLTSIEYRSRFPR